MKKCKVANLKLSTYKQRMKVFFLIQRLDKTKKNILRGSTKRNMPPNEGSPKNGLTHIHTSYSPLQQQNRNRRGEPPIIHRFKSEEKATSVFLSFLMSQIPEKTLYPKICPDVLKTAHKTMAYSWSRSSVAPTLASCKPVSQTVTNCKLWEFRDAFFLPLDGFIDEGCCISGPRPKNSLPSSWHLGHRKMTIPIRFNSEAWWSTG